MRLLDRFHGGTIFPRRIEVLAGHVAPLLPPDARILDVGAGDGTLAKRIGDLRPDTQLRGIDVLVRPETQIPVSGFDGHTLPFEKGTFDVVMFVDVLHHTDDPMELLREATRVTASAIVIEDHLREGAFADTTLRFMDRVGNARHGVSLPHTYWTAARWTAAFHELGLQPRSRTRRLGLYPIPAKWLFERNLHFLARFDVASR